MAGTGLKAIETVYNGYRFRSRLEARWAVAFDALGVQYRYEPEGFDLDGLWYLPDFWLPTQEAWVEIKPTKPTAQEEELAHRLAQASKHFVFLQYGEIPDRGSNGQDRANPYPAQSAHVHLPGGDGWDCDYWWCECPQCGYVGLEFEGRDERLACRHGDGTQGGNWDSRRLRAAFTAARGARFEHGETPRVSALPTAEHRPNICGALLYWLEGHQGAHTRTALADALGVSVPAVSRALQECMRAGAITRGVPSSHNATFRLRTHADIEW